MATVVNANPPADIVPETRDVALGDGWFPFEIHHGDRFRWAESEVSVNVAVLDSAQTLLRLVVEPGPGLGRKPLQLSAWLEDGTQLGTATVVSKEVVTFPLPPESPRAYRVLLRAEGGGQALKSDGRVLNFRAFEVAAERRVDVLPSWAMPGRGFYALEHMAGSTFRWVSNDAEIALHPARGKRLTLDVEPGPGVGSKPFVLLVLDAAAKEIVTQRVASRTIVEVPLGGVEGERIVLRTEGGGTLVKTDPRVLNFRIFAPDR